ncbi:MAG: protein translocase subunit SecF, partial [Dehalococcoidia bacterium]|nr:protein translocase subunit SecF [Dehalococcoidia bacterium]
MLNFVNNRFWFSLVSAILIVVSITSLAFFGLKLGIEFDSGSTMTLHFEHEVEQGALRESLASNGHSDAIIQRNGDGDFFIHTRELAEGEKDEVVSNI